MSAMPDSVEGADQRHRVVVIGSGFGGLTATKALKHAPVDVTVIARTQHHLFQPLLYQVATGILSEGEIALATRRILRDQRSAEVLLGDVVEINLSGRYVVSELLGQRYQTAYDSLIVAAGAGQSYFGNHHFAQFAPGMKTIDDALEIRGRILGAYERAERSNDPALRKKLLTFTVIGAGPTGVELARQIAELATQTLKSEFRHIDSTQTRVILTVAGHPNVFVIGDMASVPGVSRYGPKCYPRREVRGARHQGRAQRCHACAARTVPLLRQGLHGHGFALLGGRQDRPAGVWRFRGVAGVAVAAPGYLVGFKSKMTAVISWTGTFLTMNRGQLTMTERQA